MRASYTTPHLAAPSHPAVPLGGGEVAGGRGGGDAGTLVEGEAHLVRGAVGGPLAPGVCGAVGETRGEAGHVLDQLEEDAPLADPAQVAVLQGTAHLAGLAVHAAGVGQVGAGVEQGAAAER